MGNFLISPRSSFTHSPTPWVEPPVFFLPNPSGRAPHSLYLGRFLGLDLGLDAVVEPIFAVLFPYPFSWYAGVLSAWCLPGASAYPLLLRWLIGFSYPRRICRTESALLEEGVLSILPSGIPPISPRGLRDFHTLPFGSSSVGTKVFMLEGKRGCFSRNIWIFSRDVRELAQTRLTTAIPPHNSVSCRLYLILFPPFEALLPHPGF